MCLSYYRTGKLREDPAITAARELSLVAPGSPKHLSPRLPRKASASPAASPSKKALGAGTGTGADSAAGTIGNGEK